MERSLFAIVVAVLAGAASATTGTAVSVASFGTGTRHDPSWARVEGSGTHHSGWAQAQAWADHGVLQIDAASEMTFLTGPNNFNSVYTSSATSTARFQDYLIVGGGTPGSAGWLTFGMQVTGLLDATATADPYSAGSANWELRVNAGGQVSSIHHVLTRWGDGTGYEVSGGHAGATPYATHWFTVPIVFGNSLSLAVRLEGRSVASAHAGASDSFAGGLVALGHSVVWAGIPAVSLADHTAVAAFSVVSASGTDYVPSMVPEPAAWMLWLGGAVALVGLRQRRGAAGRGKRW